MFVEEMDARLLDKGARGFVVKGKVGGGKEPTILAAVLTDRYGTCTVEFGEYWQGEGVTFTPEEFFQLADLLRDRLCKLRA